VSSERETTADAPVRVRRAWGARFRRVLKPRADVEIKAAEQAFTPTVILACEKCGFNYRIERIDFGQGRIGAFWMCACGSRYIPPGGEDSFNLVRP